MSRSRVWRVAASVVALSAVAAGGARLALAERGDPVIVESFAAVEDPAVAARVEAQVEPAVETVVEYNRQNAGSAQITLPYRVSDELIRNVMEEK